MLKFENLTKKYGTRIILNNISYKFDDVGFYTICGASGSGKSTLLNILGLLDKEYEDGDIKFNSTTYSSLEENDIRRFRNNNFGFVFQSFNLFENDTVFNNIYMLIEYNTNLSKEYKIQKIEDLLSKLNILHLKDSIVRNLSGGEKQRVAIARALINNPSIIFCDEPTGSLDINSGENVFQLLRTLSKDVLVITITHDVELAKKYSDICLFLNDGKILDILENNHAKVEESLKILKEEKTRCEPSLSFSFILKHIKNKFKMKKIRYMLSAFLISFSLITLGTTILISSSISSTLINAFSSIIGENSLILSRKNSDNLLLDYSAASKEIVDEIYSNYESDLEYVGCNYLVDFESYFQDLNNLYNVSVNPHSVITGFGARHFNEFTYISSYSDYELYPSLSSSYKLSEDEIILGLNYSQVRQICLDLNIVRSYEALANYIESTGWQVGIYLQNDYWTYSDEITFTVKAIVPSTRSTIYHTDPLFNEYFFEDTLRFPSSLDLLEEDEYPWVMKKIYYVKTKNFQTEFANKIMYDSLYSDLLFDGDNKNYSPQTCSDFGTYTNKLYVYDVLNRGIDLSTLEIFKNLVDGNFTYYFSTLGGYVNYGTSLFVGFAKPMYLTLTKAEADQLIDTYTIVPLEDKDDVLAPDYAINGYVFNSSSQDLKMKVCQGSETVAGSLPNKVTEIAISQGIVDYYNLITSDILNQQIYLTFNYEDAELETTVRRYYKTTSLKVTGIVQGDYSLSIYQNSEFSISLFRDLFQESAFDLMIDTIVITPENEIDSEKLEQINRYFDDYVITNPIDIINESINETISYLQIILLSFSLITIISSIVVLSIINLINLEEDKKEIGIFSLLGFSNAEILKVELCQSIVFTIGSFISSSVSIVFVSILINQVFESEFGLSSTFIFPTESIILMLITTIVITIISLFFIYKPIKNIDLVKVLHS